MRRKTWNFETRRYDTRDFCKFGECGELVFFAHARRQNCNRLFVLVGEVMVDARIRKRDLEKEWIKPESVKEWQELVRREHAHHIASERALPGDAVYFGYSQEEVDFSRLRYEQRLAREDERREIERRSRELAEHVAMKEALEVATERIKEGAKVSPDELIAVARSIGVDIPIRSIGSLRKRVQWLSDHQLAYYGRKFETSPTRYYRQVQRALGVVV